MRLVFAGTPDVAVPSLEALAASSHELVAVVTRPDAPAGRGRRLVPSPVKERALELGLEVLEPTGAGEPDFLARLRSLEPDACPVVAYGNLVPPEALAVPTHGWVNLHFSLLPAWRGAAPVQHALMAGDELTGATTFLLERGLDTGPVLGVMTERVRDRDTAGALLDRLAHAGASLLVASLDGLASGEVTPVPQSGEGVSHAPKLAVDDARVDWAKPVHVIDRRVRGCTPAPGAWTTFRGERLKVGPVTPHRVTSTATVVGPDGSVRVPAPPTRSLPAHLPDDARPGQVVASKRVVHVRAADGWVELGEVRPHGKKDMRAPDWARGARVEEGEVLGGE